MLPRIAADAAWRMDSRPPSSANWATGPSIDRGAEPSSGVPAGTVTTCSRTRLTTVRAAALDAVSRPAACSSTAKHDHASIASNTAVDSPIPPRPVGIIEFAGTEREGQSEPGGRVSFACAAWYSLWKTRSASFGPVWRPGSRAHGWKPPAIAPDATSATAARTMTTARRRTLRRVRCSSGVGISARRASSSSVEAG